MWRYDFHLFYLAGQAVLSGQSPYSIVDFYAPYPIALLFALVAWMPESVAYILYLAGSLWLLWKVMGRKAIWPLLSFPVFFNLFVGQVDLQLGLAAVVLGPWALPLLIIKPQVGWVVAPWIIRQASWKRLLQAAALGGAMIALCFLVRPTWFMEWQAAIPTLTAYARRDSNFYWLIPENYKNLAVWIGAAAVLPAGFLLKDRRLSRGLVYLFAPLTNIYSASVLAEWIGPIEVVLSWVVILIVGDIHSGAPFFLIPLCIFIRQGYENREAVKAWLNRRKAARP